MKNNSLIYMAAFLFPLDNFPFMFGGAYRPVSLLFIALYVSFNLPNLLKLKFRMEEILIFITLLSGVAVGAFLNIGNHYDFSSQFDAILTLISGVVVFLGFKIFVQKSQNDEHYLNLFKWIIRGYGIAVIIGLLQFVYIYVSGNGVLEKLIQLFVNRDVFLTTRRIHFTFSEPSFISLHAALWLLPSYIILKQRNLLTRNQKFILYSFLILSLLSLSLRYYLDMFFFLALYMFLTIQRKQFIILGIRTLFIGGATYLVMQLIFVQNILNLSSDHYYRMANLFKNPSEFSSDNSFAIRSAYSQIGMSSFLDRPLLGYGLGNFNYAYREHVNEIPSDILNGNDELRSAVDATRLPQYNMYTRLLSEMGALGILVIFFVLSYVRSFKLRNFSYIVIIFLGYSQVQFDSFAFIQMYFWLALLQSDFIAKFEINRKNVPTHVIDVPKKRYVVTTAKSL